jgi:hypothetical protein
MKERKQEKRKKEKKKKTNQINPFYKKILKEYPQNKIKRRARENVTEIKRTIY